MQHSLQYLLFPSLMDPKHRHLKTPAKSHRSEQPPRCRIGSYRRARSMYQRSRKRKFGWRDSRNSPITRPWREGTAIVTWGFVGTSTTVRMAMLRGTGQRNWRSIMAASTPEDVLAKLLASTGNDYRIERDVWTSHLRAGNCASTKRENWKLYSGLFTYAFGSV